jgi:hypothetical protein
MSFRVRSSILSQIALIRPISRAWRIINQSRAEPSWGRQDTHSQTASISPVTSADRGDRADRALQRRFAVDEKSYD